MSSRYLVMDKITTIDGMEIYDPTSIDWSKFSWTNGYYTHILTKFEILKPYLISQLYYKTVAYEDCILLINNISDIFEILSGTEIYVPKLTDLQNFLLENRK